MDSSSEKPLAPQHAQPLQRGQPGAPLLDGHPMVQWDLILVNMVMLYDFVGP